MFERSLTSALLPVRLLGVGATKRTREPVVQGNLFEESSVPRQAALDHAIDKIRAQFGRGSVRRGNVMDRPTMTDDHVQEPS